MGAGDVEVYRSEKTTTAIDTALTGNGIVVADKIVVVDGGGNNVLFVVIKAA